jgi:hypothetical protein
MKNSDASKRRSGADIELIAMTVTVDDSMRHDDGDHRCDTTTATSTLVPAGSSASPLHHRYGLRSPDDHPAEDLVEKVARKKKRKENSTQFIDKVRCS